MLPQIWNNDVAQASLAPPATAPERYHELWWYSGSYASQNSTTPFYLQKGSTSTSSTASSTKLLTLNANWSPAVKYAFEATVWCATSISAQLWDFTTSSAVSSSLITTTSTTATVIRSGQFTLTPGHVYGVEIWAGAVSTNVYITDASLIIFS